MGPIGFREMLKEILDRRIPFWRGFCGHPLEQAAYKRWKTGITQWECYKCNKVFVVEETTGEWKHEDGRPAGWKGLGIL